MSNLRNSQLLQQMHSNPLRSTLAKALDVAENFAGDIQFLQLDKNLSDAGRQNAMQAILRAAIRDLRDARGPLSEMQNRLEQNARPLRCRRSILTTLSDYGYFLGSNKYSYRGNFSLAL
jgi:hypothetical protein